MPKLASLGHGPQYRLRAWTSHLEIAKYFRQGTGGGISIIQSVASATWLTANRAVYIPFELDRVCVPTAAWIFNGIAANTGNWDIGLYDEEGVRRWSSGSTAQSGGTSSVQTFTVTGVVLTRGAYYLALACNSTSTSHYQWNGATTPDWSPCGLLNQGSAFPLPATATFGAVTQTTIPLCGFTGHTPV